MADQVSSLIVRLIDQVTGPAKAIAQSIFGISSAAKQASGTTITDTISAAMHRNDRALRSARAGMLEAMGVLWGLKRALEAPIAAASSLQTALNDMGIKTGATKAQMEALRETILSAADGGNQFAKDVTAAAENLINMNVSMEDTRKLLPGLAQAATALKVPINDLTSASINIMNNLKIPVEDMSLVWDMMAKAARDGGLEVNELAKGIPSLLAKYKELGGEGAEGLGSLLAALETLRNRTGSSQEAVQRLDTLMSGFGGAKGLAKKFEDVGVNFQREMEKARKAGLEPLEALMAILDNLEKKSPKAYKAFLNSIQVEARTTLGIMRGQADEFVKLREDMMRAQGVTLEQFNAMQKTYAQSMQRLLVQWELFKTAIGTSLLAPTTALMDFLEPILQWATDFAAEYPKVTAALVGGAASLAAFGAAINALKWVGAFSFGGLLSLADGITKITGLGNLTMSAGGLALWGGAIAIVAAAIGALVYINWDEIVSGWKAFKDNFKVSEGTTRNINQIADSIDRISKVDWSFLKAPEGTGASWGKYFADVLGGTRTAEDEMGRSRPTVGWAEQFTAEIAKTASSTATDIENIKAVIKGVSDAWNDPAEAAKTYAAQATAALLGIDYAGARTSIDGVVSAWNSLLEIASRLPDMFKGLRTAEDEMGRTRPIPIGQNIIDAIKAAGPAILQAGVDLMMSLLEGLRQGWNNLWAEVSSWPGRLVGIFSGTTIAAPAVATPTIPAPAEDRSSLGPQRPTARAGGGAVLPNRPILVGEKRPEIWNPRTSGNIIPNVRDAKFGGKQVTLTPTFNLTFNGRTDDLTVDQIRKVLRDEVHHVFRGILSDTGQRFV